MFDIFSFILTLIHIRMGAIMRFFICHIVPGPFGIEETRKGTVHALVFSGNG